MVTEHSKNIVRIARRQTPGCAESRTESWYEGGGSSVISQCFVASSYEGGESTDSPFTCPVCPPVSSLSFPPVPVAMVRILVITFEIHALVRNEWSPIGCSVSCRALSGCPEGSTPPLSMSCGALLFWVGSGVELVFVVFKSFPLQPPFFDQATKQYNIINARWPIPVSIITPYRNSIEFLYVVTALIANSCVISPKNCLCDVELLQVLFPSHCMHTYADFCWEHWYVEMLHFLKTLRCCTFMKYCYVTRPVRLWNAQR